MDSIIEIILEIIGEIFFSAAAEGAQNKSVPHPLRIILNVILFLFSAAICIASIILGVLLLTSCKESFGVYSLPLGLLLLIFGAFIIFIFIRKLIRLIR